MGFHGTLSCLTLAGAPRNATSACEPSSHSDEILLQHQADVAQQLKALQDSLHDATENPGRPDGSESRI